MTTFKRTKKVSYIHNNRSRGSTSVGNFQEENIQTGKIPFKTELMFNYCLA